MHVSRLDPLLILSSEVPGGGSWYNLPPFPRQQLSCPSPRAGKKGVKDLFPVL